MPLQSPERIAPAPTAFQLERARAEVEVESRTGPSAKRAQLLRRWLGSDGLICRHSRRSRVAAGWRAALCQVDGWR